MSPGMPQPGRHLPWPGEGGPLLTAFWASLTSPGPDTATPLPVDVLASGSTQVAVVLARPDTHPPTASPAEAGLAGITPAGADLPGSVLTVAGVDVAASAPLVPAGWPEGIIPPDGFPNPVPPTHGGPGFGFGQGDWLDVMPPGLLLAGRAEDAQQVLGGIDDDCLTGVIRAWRRLASWAVAQELAAVAELARRRPADGLPGSGREYVADELSAALTLTGRAAQEHRDLAWRLANVLPATLAALQDGRIDLAKAKVICVGTGELEPGHAAAVEAAVLPKAPGQTTGQLRAAVARAVQAVDPGAATREREAAQARAHVSCWTGPAGTGHLEGHDLPPAQTLAADARLGQIAAAWKRQGAQGGMDLLRAHAYLALLLGHDTTTPPASLLLPGHQTSHPGDSPRDGGPAASCGIGLGGVAGPEASPPADSPDHDTASSGAGRAPGADAGPPNRPGDGPQAPAGLRPPSPPPAFEPGTEPGYGLPPVAAMINLTIPLATLLDHADHPGDATGYGPLAPVTARLLAAAAAGHPATRWQFTVVSPDGQALATGAARRARGQPLTAGGWTVTLTPIPHGDCDHRQHEPQYRPSPALAQRIRTRTTTCSFPGCRRPARRCDVDHTVPYEDGGPTCPCNLSPLCRRHHTLKQSEGWTLIQPSPGVLIWITPSGRRYVTMPSKHPT